MSGIPISLLAAVLTLLVGPLLAQSAKNTPAMRAGVDGFAIVTVGGLTLLLIAPEALHTGGLWALLLMILGLTLPTLLNRFGAKGGLNADRILLLGLAIHAALESAAIATQTDQNTLGLAVAAHRIPVGLAVFLLAHNTRTAWAYIGFMIVVTILGFYGGEVVADSLTDTNQAMLSAFVAGSLLHVLKGHELGHHAHEESTAECDHAHHNHHMSQKTAAAGVGALLGTGFLLLEINKSADHDHHHVMDADLLHTFISLALQSAPALLLGYVLAGLIGVFLNAKNTRWLRGSSRLGQSVKGVAFGLPLPICSCGVLPLYETLIKKGIPATAGIAFLIATPELGIDAILLSLPLLGTEMTVARVVAALLVALAVSLALGGLISKSQQAHVSPDTQDTAKSLGLKEGLRFGLVELFDHTMPWILAGLLIAALMEPLLSPELVSQVPAVLQVPLLTLISIPSYVCASGATPIAAVALGNGVSAGATLAFLIAGPATNVTTFGILSRLHSRRFALTFMLSVTLAAILVGYVLDFSGYAAILTDKSIEEHEASWLEVICLYVIGFLSLSSLFRQGPRGMLTQIIAPFRA